jgi:hypothetical protein
MARARGSRRFTKIFELWQTSEEEDGFGGFISSDDFQIGKSWCEIKTANASSKYRSTDNGITSNTNQIIITTRKRNDITYNSINQFIRYRGEFYTISNEPYEVAFDNMLIEIVATKDLTRSVTLEITPEILLASMKKRSTYYENEEAMRVSMQRLKET